ncbi:3-deoxy-D-manno-octulosonic acid transferase [Halothiobacillus sp. DCM-1]|uniref:3-deoxy-D-manno-octulosonic acid transferase n=1 Tax=Halothiobacillus sp. DCM-1 TaxID=3112558 RepID=UPI003250632F
MTRSVYGLLLGILFPWLLLDSLRRFWRAPAPHRCGLAQFGRLPANLPTEAIWLHAVSLGEVRAASSLVAALRSRWPEIPIVISTTTETGAGAARALGVPHFYAPFDYAFAIRRVMRRLRPRLLLVMETELWPNLLATLADHSVPVIIVNARLSPKSFSRYRRWGGALLAQTLARISLICAQSAEDAARFLALSTPGSVEVRDCGNLKYDHHPEAVSSWQKPPHRPVWLAASTHPGEEAIVLAAHRQLLALKPDALLVLVPRHPERAPSVLIQARSAGFSAESGGLDQPPDAVSVWIIGQTGVLMPLFAGIETIFMGGSLAGNRGGHNPIEPGVLRRAVISGRGVQNFSVVYAGLDAADAVVWVEDATTLAAAVQASWSAPESARMRGDRAYAVVSAQRGATAKIVQQIEKWLPAVENSPVNPPSKESC